ncbi:MAG: rhodanese-like domain-containing protein [Pseudomonadota bacterium]
MAIIGAAMPASAQANRSGCVSPYVVQRGDTLSLIAERFLGDVLAFRTLYAINRDVIGPDPALVEIGMVLEIPCGDATGTGARAPAAEASLPTEPAPTQPDAAQGLAQTPTLQGRGRADALSTAVAPEAGRTRFITAAELAQILDSQRPQVLDLRVGGSEQLDYIPRAVQVPDRWAELIASTSETRAALDGKLAEAGLRADRPFVLVTRSGSASSIGRAAITAWVLRSAGVADVSILWGGMAAWLERRGPAWASPVTPRSRSDTRITAPVSEVGTAAWRAALDGEGTGRLVVVGETSGEVPIPPGTVMASLPPLSAVTPDDLALNALVWLKTVPVEWESTPVGMSGADIRDAALAWLIASEVSGIRNVWLAPPLPALIEDGAEG